MDPIAPKVAARYASGGVVPRSYRVDRSVVRRRLRGINDPRVVEDSKKAVGGYARASFEHVPISHINLPPKWHPTRGDRIEQGIKKGTPLPPVELSGNPHRLNISDGIHRTNVSKEMGFTHVPAIITEWIDTPEALEAPEPEKSRLEVGDWVKLHKADRGRSYGWVSEVLLHRYDKGVKRWMYNIALVKPGDDWPDYIDLIDTEFESESAPSWGVRVKAQLP